MNDGGHLIALPAKVAQKLGTSTRLFHCVVEDDQVEPSVISDEVMSIARAFSEDDLATSKNLSDPCSPFLFVIGDENSF